MISRDFCKAGELAKKSGTLEPVDRNCGAGSTPDGSGPVQDTLAATASGSMACI